MSHGIGDFSTLCDENTKYFWPWMSSQGCPTCCFLGVLSLALVVSSHVCTMQLSLQGLPLKSQSILSLSLCPSVSLSLPLPLFTLFAELYNPFKIGKLWNQSPQFSETTGLCLGVSPCAVACNLFSGREVGHLQRWPYLFPFLGVTILHFLVSNV